MLQRHQQEKKKTWERKLAVKPYHLPPELLLVAELVEALLAGVDRISPSHGEGNSVGPLSRLLETFL
jgi:hypothetical protein